MLGILAIILAQAPGAPPESKLQCLAPEQIPAETIGMYLMHDTDGDAWFRLRIESRGTIIIGFWSKKGTFCIAAQSQVNPKS